MKLRVILALPLLFFALLPCIAAPAGAAQFTISSSGNGVFVLQGVSLAGVGGIEANISYDTATLANPRVDQGGLISGAMMVPNTNTPGVIRILVISTKVIAGSGVVATINFDRPGGSAGKILSLNTVLIDTNAAPLPKPRTQVINPAEPVTAEPATKSSQPGGTPPPSTDATVTGQGYAATGTLTLGGESGEPPKQQPAPETPQEEPVAAVKERESVETVAETAPERKSPAAEPAAPSGQVVYPSVLEGFRGFKGEKSPQSLTALFDAAAIPGVRQEPGIVLTDGVTRVKVSIQIQSSGKKAPNFALTGAKLISLKLEEGTWVIEALPESKGYEATITVLNDDLRTEIPLAVAPPLAADFAADEAEFNRFLKEPGTNKASRLDLNGDGVRNYLDDYIFTANFIVKRDARAKTPSGKQK